MSATFEVRGDDLYLNGHKVLKAWESFSGWYWFGVERLWTQDSVINGQVVEDDQIWFGLVQGFEEEWGNFSQGEIESLAPKTWPIPKCNLPHSGRRS